jgi:hypothetical protein
MSNRLGTAQADVVQSFRSLLSLDATHDDMENLNEDPAAKKKAALRLSSTNKAKVIMDDIAKIIDTDIENDRSLTGGKIKKTHVVTTKDFIDGKKKFPSATQLMNNPLAASYDGLEDDGSFDVTPSSSRRALRVTAKDMNRSFGEALDIKASGPSKGKSRSKGEVANRSANQLLNDTLRKSNGGIAETLKASQPLGVTAKDLRAVEKTISTDAKGGKGSNDDKLYKQKGPIGAQLNAPFKASMEDLGVKTEAPQPMPARKPDMNEVFTATNAQKKKHAKERVAYDD